LPIASKLSQTLLQGGGTFGSEFLVIAKKKSLTVGEIKYALPPKGETLESAANLKPT